MQKLRWGVLSSAKIGRTKVIPAIQTSLLGEVVANLTHEVVSPALYRKRPPETADHRDRSGADPDHPGSTAHLS